MGVVEADECRGLSPLLVVDHLPEVERGRDEAIPAVIRVEGDGSAQVLKLPICPRVDLKGRIIITPCTPVISFFRDVGLSLCHRIFHVMFCSVTLGI